MSVRRLNKARWTGNPAPPAVNLKKQYSEFLQLSLHPEQAMLLLRY